jgi:cytochrome c oxidase cbb3-type subunit I/II
MQAQAAQVAERLAGAGMATPADREIVALIAYLQRLGTDAKKVAPAQAAVLPTDEGGR